LGRLRKLGRIVVGRAEHLHHVVAAPQHLAVELDVDRDPARVALERRLVAQHLLDRRFHQLRPLPHQLKLLRVAQQQIEPVADQVGRRLVAGRQQRDAR
jgi:hypothetical protein